MAVPKNRHTKSRRDRRRSHTKLVRQNKALCEKCNTPTLPHYVCEHCGTYKGRQVIDVLKKVTKKEKQEQQSVR